MSHKLARVACWVVIALFSILTARADELYPDEIADKLDQTHNFECIATYGEHPTRFVVQGHFLYLAAGHTLRVIDIVDPARPNEIGWLRLAGRIGDLIPNGPALYLATDERGHGLKVIDVSDPAHPRLHKTLDWSNMGLSAYRMGNYMFIDEAGKYGDQWGVYRISTPLEPAKIAAGGHESNRDPFCTDGDRFYQAIVRGLPDHDFSIAIRDLTSSVATIRECKVPYSNNLFQDFRTFLNDFNETSNTISNYSSPLMLAFSGKSREFYKLIEFEWPNNAGFMQLEKTVTIGKWRLTDTDQYRLTMANDPETPLLETKYEPALVGNALYAIKDDRIKIFDLSGDRLVERGVFPETKVTDSIQASGSIAVVPSEDELSLFNVADPFDPAPVGRYRFKSGVNKVKIVDTRAYLMNGEGKLELLDISDPARPRQLANDRATTASMFGSTDATETASSTTLTCRLAKNSIDILEKTAGGLALCGQINRTIDEKEGAEYSVQLLGNALFYIKINHQPFPFVWPSFDIYDIANPAMPKLVGHEGFNPDDAPDDGGWYFGPPAPAKLPPDPAAKYPGWYLCVPHSHRTTGRSARGVMIYDCSNPLHPRLAGFYDRLSVNAPASLQKENILIADENNGLLVLHHIGAGNK